MQVTSAMERIAVGRAWLRRSWLAIQDDTLLRWGLVGLAILLQDLLELPRDSLSHALGPRIGLGVMVVQLAAIGLMIAAVVLPDRIARLRPRALPRWVLALVLGVTALAALNGVRLTAQMVVTSFSAVQYANDGTTLDQYAAQQLLHGHDPYATVTITGAVQALHQPHIFVTPLHAGTFARRSWLNYPDHAAIRAVFDQVPPGQALPEVESHVSYPALAFLALVPFVAVGLPSVVLFSVLCIIAFAWVALRAVAPEVRPWLGLLILIDMPVLDSVMTGALDVTTMLLLFVAWLRWRDALWSTIFFGLALATKQQAWFFIPFFAIFLWQQLGWRATASRLAGAAGIFLALNLPFILHNRAAWVTGVLAPVRDPMFPLGQGIVQLALARVLPLWPQRVYTVLEVLAFAGLLAWYAWRGARRWPQLAFILALVPLWFAWRSLPSYFAFSALPMIALTFGWDANTQATKIHADREKSAAEHTENGFAENRLVASGRRLLTRWQADLKTYFVAFAEFRDLRVSSFLSLRSVWLLWALTRGWMLLNLILGQHYCDPQFYQYAGDFAVGKLPYRDVAVEYPPLALVIMILPALPLLPFAGIAPRPDANPHPLHPDPIRYGAYGISFGIMLVLCDALTLWLVTRAARRLLPRDPSGAWSGLLYMALAFASGAVLQKFDLIVGTLCLAAIVALLAERDGLAWATLAAATLVKGFPLLLAPLFVIWRLWPQGGPTPSPSPSADGAGRSDNGRRSRGSCRSLSAAAHPLSIRRWGGGRGVGPPWIVRAMIGGGIVSLVVLGPALALGGVGALVHSVAYHTSRGIEIESVPASIILALGWLPGLGVTTVFDRLDLSRDVLSPLAGPVGALADPALVVLVLVIYGLFWYNASRVARPHSATRALSEARQRLVITATVILFIFILCFRAMPLHYILSIAPLAALVRLPRSAQRRWLGALFAACLAGGIVISCWHQLVALAPGIVLLLIARNAALVAATVILVGSALWSGHAGRKGIAHDIRATETPTPHRDYVVSG